VVVVAAGKASPAMARVAAEQIGSQVRAGLVIGPQPGRLASSGSDPVGSGISPGEFEFIGAGHPLPDAESERAGRKALALAEALGVDETLLVLLSGGASALMAVPADGLTLDDKRRTTERLLRLGANIDELNTVRKHLSAVKGGGLAARTPGRCLTYAISDVVGDDPSVIASGPTVPDPSTHQQALDVLDAHGGLGAYPSAVIGRLEGGAAGRIVETPKPGDARFARSRISVIGSRRDAVEGAAADARHRGYHVLTIETPVVGESRVAAREHVNTVAARAHKLPRPLCVVSAGETTVRVVGRGRGGRNQEFVLAAVPLMRMLAGSAALASVGTDGIDGPTDAAGALADETTLDRARSAGLASPARFLDDNNAHAFFAATGDLIRTGPTDTNVGDLQVMLLA
jgi:glycerate 2-kinase